ncbi:head completion/stabilization protein [Enterovibrio nigricans]|uniref:Phage head completion protein (GPL) n=1 Tax=Enterovibrio nigricans DSM 22720 TaxID=1121868 RepID=A0A1T4UF42_9GAMM|nr:head completion/stabilization protein [Enterovibrio nigricans]PKF51112.1 head protein [Enterovibrio nigricans]SKA51210.1 Phage head completion protein (GPL) [Enterovibrio nigricans DSM 22720]
MSGFGGKVPTNQNTNIAGNGWPDLSTADFRKVRRIPHVFDESSVAMAIEIAADNVQGQLAGVDQSLTGAKLALYQRAVYALAHADLLPEFATQNRRDEAENTAEDAGEQGDRFRAQSTRDIAQIKGESPNGIELL